MFLFSVILSSIKIQLLKVASNFFRTPRCLLLKLCTTPPLPLERFVPFDEYTLQSGSLLLGGALRDIPKDGCEGASNQVGNTKNKTK